MTEEYPDTLVARAEGAFSLTRHFTGVVDQVDLQNGVFYFTTIVDGAEVSDWALMSVLSTEEQTELSDGSRLAITGTLTDNPSRAQSEHYEFRLISS
ncbi:MAG TPA: hypothetical protein VLF88_01195 [Candidatus Babeliales bacterium]|nr:hypothetical protein [Candidatus Babeliales bacterium]